MAGTTTFWKIDFLLEMLDFDPAMPGHVILFLDGPQKLIHGIYKRDYDLIIPIL